MGPQIFLGLSALLWLPYGLFLVVQPSYLEAAAGVGASSATGVVELRAMYGGLQAAIGVLCALGCVSRAWRAHALVTVGFLTAGLFLARLVGATVDASFGPYTVMALGLEIVSAALAFAFVRRHAEWIPAIR